MSEFKVGDKVRVIGGSEDYRTLGEEGVVKELYGLNNRDGYNTYVKFETEDFEGDTGLSFADDELELVTKVNVEDVVNHPSHCTAFGAEVISITEHLNFCRGNAVKYIARAGLKNPDKELEDLEKAQWYLDREIARVKAEKK